MADGGQLVLGVLAPFVVAKVLFAFFLVCRVLPHHLAPPSRVRGRRAVAVFWQHELPKLPRMCRGVVWEGCEGP